LRIAWLIVLALLPLTARADVQFAEEGARVEQLLTVIDQRLGLMGDVAAYKYQHHAPVADPAREAVVISHAVSLGAPLGLAAAPVQQLFELQVRLAREVETDSEQHWRTGGFDHVGQVPDLNTEIRPRLDQLTTQLLRALYLAAPALGHADFVARYRASAERLLTSPGWTGPNRAELLAALAHVRLESVPALERIKAAGALRIGTTGDYAPFSLESDGKLSGADIELAIALAHTLGAAPVFVRTSWPHLLDDLRANDFDLAIGGVSATPARAAAGTLSKPYLSGGKTILARCSDGARFTSLAALDRPGVRIIVNPGGTNEQYVRANIHRAAVRVYADNKTIFDEIRAGRADAMITDDAEVELQHRRHAELCRTLPGTLTHADKVILMARDPALAAAVDTFLAQALAAGTPARLVDQALSN
jgi:cyclohexadienyl dehydratase